MDIIEIERRLNEGLERSDAERKQCRDWLQMMVGRGYTLEQLDDMCFEDSASVFDEIFG